MVDIQIEQVSFSYPNGYQAVKEISLTIGAGENIAIIGQNGAGKSTTAKMLNGLETPTEGRIMIGEMDTKKYTTAQLSRVVGYVFQNPDDQIFHSNILAEIEYGPRKMKLPEEQLKKQVEQAIDMTGIRDYIHENPYNLPLSIRKFVTIAAIIASDCQIMVFDEPTAGQDLLGNQRLANILQELHRQGKTTITISHDMDFVATQFKRIVVMANKQIVETGTPKQIFSQPKVLEIARIKQPYNNALCFQLGLASGTLTLAETVTEILSHT